MLKLNRDVISIIFSYLNDKSIGRFYQVSKFCNVMKPPDVYWKSRLSLRYPSLPTVIMLQYKTNSWYDYYKELSKINELYAKGFIEANSHKNGRIDYVIVAMSLIPDPSKACKYVFQRGRNKGNKCGNKPINKHNYCNYCMTRRSVQHKIINN